MFLLILILSCTVNKFRIKEKVRREDITEAIHSRSELSRSILEEVSVNDALTKNNEGLLPIEEAMALLRKDIYEMYKSKGNHIV